MKQIGDAIRMKKLEDSKKRRRSISKYIFLRIEDRDRNLVLTINLVPIPCRIELRNSKRFIIRCSQIGIDGGERL